MQFIYYLNLAIQLIRAGLFLFVALGGLAGFITVLSTRADAFPAADRMPKMAWAGLLAGSTLVCVPAALGQGGTGLFYVVGAIVIGVYWFDVRPNIKDLLAGNSGW